MPFSVKLLQGLDKLEPDLKSVMFGRQLVNLPKLSNERNNG